MLYSFDCSYRLANSTLDKITAKTPKSRRLAQRNDSKVSKNRTKTSKSILKISIDPLPTRISLNNYRSTKATAMHSSKNTSCKIKLASPSSRTRKNSTRLFRTASNHSLKMSTSPKNSHIYPEKIEFPMKPTKALSVLKHELTTFEHGEILKYSEIYFMGTISNKLIPRAEEDNYGFDDKHADYLLVKNDHIAYRYEIMKLLGKGSFGQVCECFDHKKQESIALKIIKNKPKFHQQAAIEVKVLHAIRESDPQDSRNIIRMKNYFSFRSHICITFELVSINLYEFLRLNNFQGLSLTLVKCFAKQMLNALEYTSTLQIVHCDLKPENILLTDPKKAMIKLIDFGSSCFISERLHTYIQSRFYRAPEIMLGIPYTTSIDIWSLGCILVELFTGQPLWPGDSEKDQLLRIISYLGLPSTEVLKRATRKYLFFEGDRLKNNKLSDGGMVEPMMNVLEDTVKCNDTDFIDFLKKCFNWDPDERISPSEGLGHPWIHTVKTSKSSILEKKNKRK